jgi:hypothetical protein
MKAHEELSVNAIMFVIMLAVFFLSIKACS